MTAGPAGYGLDVLSPTPAVLPANLTLVEESELVVCGVRAMLAPYRDINVVPVRGTERGTVADLVLYDPVRPRASGQRERYAHRAGWVFYTWDPTTRLIQAAEAGGVRGVLSKRLGARDLAAAVLRLHRGEFVVERGPEAEGACREGAAAGLTIRESEVVGLITAGLSNHDIAEQMTLSINSIKSYIRSAYRKMGVESRSQAVLWGVRHGCVVPERLGHLVVAGGTGTLSATSSTEAAASGYGAASAATSA